MVWPERMPVDQIKNPTQCNTYKIQRKEKLRKTKTALDRQFIWGHNEPWHSIITRSTGLEKWPRKMVIIYWHPSPHKMAGVRNWCRKSNFPFQWFRPLPLKIRYSTCMLLRVPPLNHTNKSANAKPIILQNHQNTAYLTTPLKSPSFKNTGTTL